jgi:hypothetical protein
MEVASTSETSVNFYQTTRRNNPGDSHHHFTCLSFSFVCVSLYLTTFYQLHNLYSIEWQDGMINVAAEVHTLSEELGRCLWIVETQGFRMDVAAAYLEARTIGYYHPSMRLQGRRKTKTRSLSRQPITGRHSKLVPPYMSYMRYQLTTNEKH